MKFKIAISIIFLLACNSGPSNEIKLDRFEGNWVMVSMADLNFDSKSFIEIKKNLNFFEGRFVWKGIESKINFTFDKASNYYQIDSDKFGVIKVTIAESSEPLLDGTLSLTQPGNNEEAEFGRFQKIEVVEKETGKRVKIVEPQK